MTREEAIKICVREKEQVQQALDVCAEGDNYVSPDGIITALDYVEAMEVAIDALRYGGPKYVLLSTPPADAQTIDTGIDALREQEERSKGCEFCDGSEKNLLVDDDIPFRSYNSIRLDGDKAFLDDAGGFSIRIKFCPMCGRRLEEP